MAYCAISLSHQRQVVDRSYGGIWKEFTVGTVGYNRAAAFEITTAFDFMSMKNDSVRVQRAKTTVFSALRTDFDKNIGRTGRQYAAAFR